ncbi:zinc-dependent alcohol dehydrogenase family protein [Rhizobium sp. BK251]|uniref:zinc-dependent alcohol dehydrogenase family protein n=1 Tax=Rhizobium sp. BK251 TaxID=2512125 RepID=UPI001043972B|nr:zinc-dependent alcohol dehydrogenase family protein [Rhizobium sp. BK251]TCL62710.1 NADPH2:quinone reductase [Rhizobium sp. BK251]
MKAVIAAEQGSPDILHVVDLPKPEPGAGQVLVRIRATSVNPIDTKVRKAELPMTPASFPAVLGSDFSGTVEAVGPGVTRFAPTDEVFGFAGGFRGPDGDIPGALAEFAVFDADLIAKMPKNVDFRTAAALPLTATTAWTALFEKVTITPTTRVLITGGAGGVGYMAVQLAHAAGADVIAVTRSTLSAEVAISAGARACVDLTGVTPQEIVEKHTDGHGFDVIFDTVGGTALDAAFQMVKPTGDIVTVVGAASHNLAPLYLKGANLHMVLVLAPIMFGVSRPQQGRTLERISRLVEDGKLSPRLDPQRFALTETANAHRKLEAGEANGKLIIEL